MCKNTRPIQLIFQQLPSEFTRQDLMRLLKRHHRTLPIEEVLYRFKSQGFIHHSSRANHYFKTVNT